MFDDFDADENRISAIHEAGHAVVYMHFGVRVLEVALTVEGGITRIEPSPLVMPDLSDTVPQAYAAQKNGLIATVAGYAANYLGDLREHFGRWPTQSERLAHRDFVEDTAKYLVSSEYRLAGIEGNTFGGCDTVKAVEAALSLVLGRKWKSRKPKVEKEEVLAEIVAAEGRAERILKKRWVAVEKIAAAVLRSKQGRIGYARLTTLALKWFPSTKRMVRRQSHASTPACCTGQDEQGRLAGA